MIELPKTVSRETIITAIMVEPLKSNQWVHNSRRYGKCEVCAVGAVLRRLGVQDRDIHNAAYQVVGDDAISKGNIASLIDQRLYMNALSVKFETLCDEAYKDQGEEAHMGDIRQALVEFVQAEFPAEVRL